MGFCALACACAWQHRVLHLTDRQDLPAALAPRAQSAADHWPPFIVRGCLEIFAAARRCLYTTSWASQRLLHTDRGWCFNPTTQLDHDLCRRPFTRSPYFPRYDSCCTRGTKMLKWESAPRWRVLNKIAISAWRKRLRKSRTNGSGLQCQVCCVLFQNSRIVIAMVPR